MQRRHHQKGQPVLKAIPDERIVEESPETEAAATVAATARFLAALGGKAMITDMDLSRLRCPTWSVQSSVSWNDFRLAVRGQRRVRNRRGPRRRSFRFHRPASNWYTRCGEVNTHREYQQLRHPSFVFPQRRYRHRRCTPEEGVPVPQRGAGMAHGRPRDLHSS